MIVASALLTAAQAFAPLPPPNAAFRVPQAVFAETLAGFPQGREAWAAVSNAEATIISRRSPQG